MATLFLMALIIYANDFIRDLLKHHYDGSLVGVMVGNLFVTIAMCVPISNRLNEATPFYEVDSDDAPLSPV